jgi:hypothetical protein
MTKRLQSQPCDRPTRAAALGRRGSFRVEGEGVAARYAAELLSSLGLEAELCDGGSEGERELEPSAEWAQSGAMLLTGLPDGPPLLAPAAVASCMRGAERALSLLSRELPGAALDDLDGPALLGERAALAQPGSLRRRGTIAPGGSCRLLACADGWLAVNLARPDDERLLPAWLESVRRGGPTDMWSRVAAAVATRERDLLVARGRWMGLAVAPAADADGDASAKPWCEVAARGPARYGRQRAPRVVDLSSLWAGPLCTQLLGACGAQVVKLESLQRPDGARRGSPAFFDLMNGGKRSVAVDIESESGLEQLRGLLARADIVIESSRPRALAQLGVDAEELVRSGLGKTWLSITGYGRGEPEAGWVAFGDDAAAAAGLTATAGGGTPVFCGDAIADPLTGLHAAVAALASWLTGGGRLLDVSLRNVAARATRLPAPDRASPARPLPPRARGVTCRAASLGRDTRAVLAECGIHC